MELIKLFSDISGILKDSTGATYCKIDCNGMIMSNETGELFTVSALDSDGIPAEALNPCDFPGVYWDIETLEIIKAEQLIFQFATLKYNNPESYEDWTFCDYLREVTGKNGCLIPLHDAIKQYAEIREDLDECGTYSRIWERFRLADPETVAKYEHKHGINQGSAAEWKSVELFNPTEINSFREFLRENNIEFESSGCGRGVHFEALVTPEALNRCNEFLSAI